MLQAPSGKDISQKRALADAVSMIGGQAAMARLLGITQPSVWRWVRLGKLLPAEHVRKVEEATGISRHDLRPDLYPRETGGDPVPPTGLEPER